jgi:hypothetical protein
VVAATKPANFRAIFAAAEPPVGDAKLEAGQIRRADGSAGGDVVVVVSTGGRSPESLGLTVPANARIAPFLSYPELLPRTEVMVTNGGYGGTQMALYHGVLLVVAGSLPGLEPASPETRIAQLGQSARGGAVLVR